KLDQRLVKSCSFQFRDNEVGNRRFLTTLSRNCQHTHDKVNGIIVDQRGELSNSRHFGSHRHNSETGLGQSANDDSSSEPFFTSQESPAGKPRQCKKKTVQQDEE